jgi:hypothetical protein
MRTQQTIIGKIAAAAMAVLLPMAACQTLSAQDTAAAPAPAGQPVITQAPSLPAGVSEVLKLQKGGVPADVILNYVNNSPLSFYLTADNLIYAQQQGVPAPVITAMIQRYGEKQRQMAQAQPQSAPAPVAQAPAASYGYPPENPAANFNNALQARAANPVYYPTPAPAYPVYYPTYYDSYSYYPSAYNYWPAVTFGFGFGGGGYYHGGFAGGRGGFAGHGGGGFGHR